MAWYRTYRPQLVSELAIKPVRDYFAHLLATGRYSHAYLFTGPKGIGKTSSARLLARILNDPQNTKAVLAKKGSLKEPTSQDPVLQKIAQGKSQVVIEQDAASNRGIDDIRALQEAISLVPTEGLIRVVILDEVHMLTTEAFNALLKMLEEPPDRVVFALATTDPHKVPQTIQSRCEIIRFRHANESEIKSVLKNIAKQEKIKVSDQVLDRLVVTADGSFRDAVKHFESVVNNGKVEEELLNSLFGYQDVGKELLALLAGQDYIGIHKFFVLLRQQGQNFVFVEQDLFKELQSRLHRAIERQEAPSTIAKIVKLFEYLVSRVGGSEPISGLKLELACLGWCLPTAKEGDGFSGDQGTAQTKKTAKKNTQKSHSNGVVKSSQVSAATTVVKDDDQAEIDLEDALDNYLKQNQLASKVAKPSTKKSSANIELDYQEVVSLWKTVLLYARTKSQSLEALLRQAKLGGVTGGQLIIEFELPFHQEQLETPKYAALFQEIIRDKIHPEIDFSCRLIPATKSDDLPLKNKRTITTKSSSQNNNQENGKAVSDQQSADKSEDKLLQAVEEAVLSFEKDLV